MEFHAREKEKRDRTNVKNVFLFWSGSLEEEGEGA